MAQESRTKARTTCTCDGDEDFNRFNGHGGHHKEDLSPPPRAIVELPWGMLAVRMDTADTGLDAALFIQTSSTIVWNHNCILLLDMVGLLRFMERFAG
jgi:hypothetical protein